MVDMYANNRWTAVIICCALSISCLQCNWSMYAMLSFIEFCIMICNVCCVFVATCFNLVWTNGYECQQHDDTHAVRTLLSNLPNILIIVWNKFMDNMNVQQIRVWWVSNTFATDHKPCTKDSYTCCLCEWIWILGTCWTRGLKIIFNVLINAPIKFMDYVKNHHKTAWMYWKYLQIITRHEWLTRVRTCANVC